MKGKPAPYENPVKPIPDPNRWFRVRIVFIAPKIRVFVDGPSEPGLDVGALGGPGPGKVGSFVGNDSGGDFAGLKVSSA